MNSSFSRYFAVTAGLNPASSNPKQVPSDGTLFVGQIPELLSGKAMTVIGDNDTSAAGKGAVRGVPGDGEIPMRAVRFRLSAESPFSTRVMKKKYGAEAKRQGTAANTRCPDYIINYKEKKQ